MNIIANDCTGAYLYTEQLKQDFQNPFIWSSIDIDNFCILIEKFNVLDFNNISYRLIENNSDVCKNGSQVVQITIDNTVDVYYFHYIYNTKYKTPTKAEGHTQCSCIVQYALDTYRRRLEKMIEKPIFLWDASQKKWYNKSNVNIIERLKNIKTDYTIIVYAANIENSRNDNMILIKNTTGRFEVNIGAKNIYKLILDLTQETSS